MAVKLGFLGFGKFAQTRMECVRLIGDVEVVGFYDPAINAASDLDGVICYSAPEQLIEAVDAVIISVPPRLAPQYVIQSLKKGLHVFCEKPAAVNMTELRPIADYIDDKKILAYGFNHRQHPSVVRMKETLDHGYLGKVLWMRGRYGKEVADDYKYNWRCNYELNGGGIVIDQGIHMVDLMSYLGGGFTGAHAVLSNGYLNIDRVEDNAFLTLYCERTGLSASVHSTITQWRYLFSLEVFCEQGSMVLNGLRTKSGSYGDEVLSIKPNVSNMRMPQNEEFHYEANTSWQKEMEAFIVSIKDGVAYPYANYSDACDTTRVIDLIYKNAKWI